MATMAEKRTGVWAMERYAPLAGVLAVVGWVVGLLTVGDLQSKNKGIELLTYYQAHDSRILVGFIIWAIGTLFFFWFLGSLRSRLLTAEGGDGRLTALAYGGGVATAVCIALNAAPDAAAAISKDDLDASAARAIHTIGDAFFLGAEYFLVILLVATALNALRTRVFPTWYAWLSLVIALVLLIGIIGWAALIFAFPIWVLITTFLLWRPATAARTAGP
jgi:hypothetical protein